MQAARVPLSKKVRGRLPPRRLTLVSEIALASLRAPVGPRVGQINVQAAWSPRGGGAGCHQRVFVVSMFSYVAASMVAELLAVNDDCSGDVMFFMSFNQRRQVYAEPV
jgi:hypothetical protein